MEHIHQVELGPIHEEENLDVGIIIEVVGTDHKEELSNDEEVVVHHG
jgi:hypothetical protein